jgi:DNA transposition AAA+ family ATPase
MSETTSQVLDPEIEAQSPDTTPELDKGRGQNRVNIGGNTVTSQTDHLPEDHRLLVRWLFTHARDNELGWDEVETQTKVSTTVLYRIWTGKYRYPATEKRNGADYPHPKANQQIPLDSICEKIARYKRIVEQREAIVSTGFVETTTWARVDWLCSRAFARQKIGFLYGESQAGKTTCLVEHMRRNNHGQTSYVEMPPSAGVQLMTKTIAKALHVSGNTSFDKLISDVVDALDSSKLLIIDEVHRVFTTYQKTSVMRCLDVLRYIHDQTKCGLVLCGTNVFRDNLKQGEFFQYLKQLRRRGLYEVQLPAVPVREDLDLVAERFGLPPAGGEAEEIVVRMAKQDGFGKYITRLTDAAEMARKRKEALTWAHFVKACHIIEKMAMDVGGDR